MLILITHSRTKKEKKSHQNSRLTEIITGLKSIDKNIIKTIQRINEMNSLLFEKNQ